MPAAPHDGYAERCVVRGAPAPHRLYAEKAYGFPVYDAKHLKPLRVGKHSGDVFPLLLYAAKESAAIRHKIVRFPAHPA